MLRSPLFNYLSRQLSAPLSSFEVNLSKDADAELANCDYFLSSLSGWLVNDLHQKYQCGLKAVIAVISPTFQARRGSEQAMHMHNDGTRSLYTSGPRVFD